MPLTLVKNVVFKAKKPKVIMPEKSIKKLDDFVKKKIFELKDELRSLADRKRLAKYLGKYLLLVAVLTSLLFMTAIVILLHTGCRPNEAAYVVYKKSIEKTVYF